MGKIYGVLNGPAPGAAATPKVTTAAVIKTMLQLATSANREARLVQWWWEGDGSTAAAPGQIELISMANLTTPATVTAYGAGDIRKQNDPNAVAPQITLGTTASGYTATAEGTLVSPQTIEQHLVPPTSGIYIQFPEGRVPEIAASSMARIRNTLAVAVNAVCGLMWEE